MTYSKEQLERLTEQYERKFGEVLDIEIAREIMSLLDRIDGLFEKNSKEMTKRRQKFFRNWWRDHPRPVHPRR